MLLVVIVVGFAFILAERIVPDQKLPEVRGWWLRVIIINIFQVGIIYLGAFTWEKWLSGVQLIQLSARYNPFVCALISYFVITFVFYWWHRFRHTNNNLWLLCHQLHHSASRIETITSFYKHPFEIILDSVIICIINRLLGVGIDGAAFVLLLTAVAEYFYHMNIRTPRWLGYIIQRPEMHRIHHQQGKHFNNFSDLPVWDMLFGTFENPDRSDRKCGFKPERELRFAEILVCRNVNNSYKQERKFSGFKMKILPVVVCIAGSLQIAGYILHNEKIRGLGFASGASPLPLVFTEVKGVETFALDFKLNITTASGKEIVLHFDHEAYSKLKGPYNRRNVYGAAFAYAPVMPDTLRSLIYERAFCNDAPLLREFGITEEVKCVQVTIQSKTKNDKRSWNYLVLNHK